MRAGARAIEAIFSFETAQGRGSGVLRLTAGAEGTKAWTLLTTLDEIKGHAERVGKARPTGQSYSRDFRGPNWLDLRAASAAYADRDPAVLVVGGGQAGLSIAARLTQLQVDTLIVDREPRIGDNWRKRYHALTLHNQVQVNHLPYMPFPPNWPTYIPKDKVANWFESYVESMELNYWPATALESGTYDEKDGRWSARAAPRRRDDAHNAPAPCGDGDRRQRHCEHPGHPDAGRLPRHRAALEPDRDGEDFGGKKALVIGTGNSGHDIAQDLWSSGAEVTLIQRGPSMVVNIEPSAQLAYALYDEGPPLEDCDLIATSMPFALARKSHIMLTEQGRTLDKPLLDALERVGFRLDFGADGSGWQFKHLERGGGYYFNVGCSDLIAERKDRPCAVRRHRTLRRRGRTDAQRRTHPGRSGRAVDRLQDAGSPGAKTVRRRGRGARRADLGLRRGPRAAQHLCAHRAARSLVHRRQLCPVPDLLEVSRPADQGAE